MLGDYIKPSKFGDLSVKVYFQVDCKLFRFKIEIDSMIKFLLKPQSSKNLTINLE